MDEVCSCLCLKGSLEIMKTYVLLAVSLWICVCAHMHACAIYINILTIFLIPQTLNMSVIHFMGIVSNDGLDFGCPD